MGAAPAAGTSAQAVARDGAAPGALRVMTYNIKHGQTNAECEAPEGGGAAPPDCGLDLSRVIAVIRAHDPDIVGLQEVDRFWARSGGEDQPERLAEALGMTPCYGPNLDHAPDAHAGVRHQYGTLILSRYPMTGCETRALPRTGDNEQRGLTRAIVEARGVRLQVYNTHLHVTAADRRLQSADLARAVDAAPPGPKILLGDFNARPDAGELDPILTRFTDAWVQAGRPTADNPHGLTSPARLDAPPRSRIDYVFVSPGIAVRSARVPVDANTRLASDHYPVVVQFDVE